MNDYRIMTHTEHILSRPELYIGNMDVRNGISDGLRCVLLEGLLNCNDACYRVQDAYIEVMIEGNTISFENKGTIRLIDGNRNIPELVFSSTNSEYNQQYYGGGGIGIKAVNIFSTQFRIQIGNSQEHLHYDQTWQNNAQIKHAPIITDYHGADFVKISFELDFERFGFTSLTPEMINVLHNYCQTLDKRIELRGYFGDEPIKEPECN